MNVMKANMKNYSQAYLFTIHLFEFIEHYNSKHYSTSLFAKQN